MAAAWLSTCEAVDLRKDEDVGQVIPEVEDELQVYVGLARASWFGFGFGFGFGLGGRVRG